MKILTNKRILIISPEAWDHNFVSKHHYALNLAEQNNSVFFLNPPSERFAELTAKIQRNLFVINYRSIRGLNKLPLFFSRYFWRRIAAEVQNLAGGRFDIVWTFDPYRFQELIVFNSDIYIYFIADVHKNKTLEKATAKNAHFILSPSNALLNRIDGTFAKKLNVSHGVSPHFFLRKKAMNFPGQALLKAGYAGNLLIPMIDKILILALVQKFQEVDFVFAGENKDLAQDTVWRKIMMHKNVFCIGRVSNLEVPDFLQSCHMLFLAYQPVLNSHKVLEYLSSGKPIVSTPIEEYFTALPDELIYMAKDRQEYFTLFEFVINNIQACSNNHLAEQRINYAQQKTYPLILAEIDSFIAKSLLERT